jgi:hypothetical protein
MIVKLFLSVMHEQSVVVPAATLWVTRYAFETTLNITLIDHWTLNSNYSFIRRECHCDFCSFHSLIKFYNSNVGNVKKFPKKILKNAFF